ncbi:hypothetical protein J3E71DRAFT_222032 [Bipolaris maydis]|nr:hypothetical protein J3E71DRAFT_222032 [Bipolaris maydis]
MSACSYLDCYREPLLPDSIRLLRLLPNEDETAPIQCELFHYSLQESGRRTHPYEALSYVWGHSGNPQSIFIREHRSKSGHGFTSGNDLPVTENLHAALTHLRYPLFERIIWVDAVCMNQKDDREKEQQIQFMAKIYALASRVIVWLGEAAEDSDEALHWIRVAGGIRSKIPLSNETVQQAIVALLQRPWFRRVWVLQEVAAARHILIMCGTTEIDGYAFSLGVDLFEGFDDARVDLQSATRSVTYLIKGSIFRSDFSMSRSGRSSLDICPLGELVDLYRTHEATRRHDKVFALIGMSSDDLSKAKLLPDYSGSWEELLKRLTKYLLHQDISRHHSRWDRTSTTSVQNEDVICLLQGASNPTIIRQRQDHFEVIAIAARPLERILMSSGPTDWPTFLKSGIPFIHDLILIWDWEISLDRLQYPERCDEMFGCSTELRGSLERATRIWNVARVLGEARASEEALKVLPEAIKHYETVFGIQPSQELENEYDLTPLSWASKNGHDIVLQLLLAKDGVDPNMKDGQSNRTSLSWAAEKGHETAVKLLLDTGKVEVDSKDVWGRTPLWWAAERGHETVVKLLLETGKVEVNSKDMFERAPLSRAAETGHVAVVKLLLLEMGKVDVDSKDFWGRTPLFLAWENRHKNLFLLRKLLL